MNGAFGKWGLEDMEMPPTTYCPHCNIANLYWVQVTTIEGWRLCDGHGVLHDCGHNFPKHNLWEIK